MRNKDFLHKLYGWKESYFVSFVAFLAYSNSIKNLRKVQKQIHCTSSMTLKAAQRYDTN